MFSFLMLITLLWLWKDTLILDKPALKCLRIKRAVSPIFKWVRANACTIHGWRQNDKANGKM